MQFTSAILLFLLMATSSVARAQVPLPADLSIEVPAAGVPAADAAFSGAWGNGDWSGILPAALVVEQIHADGTALVVYAVGSSAQAGIAAKWLRLPGLIEHGQLTLPMGHGTVVQYRLDGSGHLDGDYTVAVGGRSNVVLQRIVGTSAEILATAALPVQPIWQDIRIPEHARVAFAAGQDIALQATLYRMRLPGRQPLTIINHGSTDGERPGIPTVYRFEGQARWFLSRGYNVVVPMRKGRGLSGGPMMEPSDRNLPDALQVDSAVEDLDTVVDAMRAEPWVDPKRIVLVGQSRGGLLVVVYAARYPDKVAGVVNFSGGWWSGYRWGAAFNTAEFGAAGKTGKVPELWLYADHDRYFTLEHARTNFDAFRANGGVGEFHAFEGIPGNGHALFGFIDLWDSVVADYLRRIDGG